MENNVKVLANFGEASAEAVKIMSVLSTYEEIRLGLKKVTELGGTVTFALDRVENPRVVRFMVVNSDGKKIGLPQKCDNLNLLAWKKKDTGVWNTTTVSNANSAIAVYLHYAVSKITNALNLPEVPAMEFDMSVFADVVETEVDPTATVDNSYNPFA